MTTDAWKTDAQRFHRHLLGGDTIQPFLSAWGLTAQRVSYSPQRIQELLLQEERSSSSHNNNAATSSGMGPSSLMTLFDVLKEDPDLSGFIEARLIHAIVPSVNSIAMVLHTLTQLAQSSALGVDYVVQQAAEAAVAAEWATYQSDVLGKDGPSLPAQVADLRQLSICAVGKFFAQIMCAANAEWGNDTVSLQEAAEDLVGLVQASVMKKIKDTTHSWWGRNVLALDDDAVSTAVQDLQLSVVQCLFDDTLGVMAFGLPLSFVLRVLDLLFPLPPDEADGEHSPARLHDVARPTVRDRGGAKSRARRRQRPQRSVAHPKTSDEATLPAPLQGYNMVDFVNECVLETALRQIAPHSSLDPVILTRNVADDVAADRPFTSLYPLQRRVFAFEEGVRDVEGEQQNEEEDSFSSHPHSSCPLLDDVVLGATPGRSTLSAARLALRAHSSLPLYPFSMPLIGSTMQLWSPPLPPSAPWTADANHSGGTALLSSHEVLDDATTRNTPLIEPHHAQFGLPYTLPNDAIDVRPYDQFVSLNRLQSVMRTGREQQGCAPANPSLCCGQSLWGVVSRSAAWQALSSKLRRRWFQGMTESLRRTAPHNVQHLSLLGLFSHQATREWEWALLSRVEDHLTSAPQFATAAYSGAAGPTSSRGAARRGALTCHQLAALCCVLTVPSLSDGTTTSIDPADTAPLGTLARYCDVRFWQFLAAPRAHLRSFQSGDDAISIDQLLHLLSARRDRSGPITALTTDAVIPGEMRDTICGRAHQHRLGLTVEDLYGFSLAWRLLERLDHNNAVERCEAILKRALSSLQRPLQPANESNVPHVTAELVTAASQHCVVTVTTSGMRKESVGRQLATQWEGTTSRAARSSPALAAYSRPSDRVRLDPYSSSPPHHHHGSSSSNPVRSSNSARGAEGGKRTIVAAVPLQQGRDAVEDDPLLSELMEASATVRLVGGDASPTVDDVASMSNAGMLLHTSALAVVEEHVRQHIDARTLALRRRVERVSQLCAEGPKPAEGAFRLQKCRESFVSRRCLSNANANAAQADAEQLRSRLDGFARRTSTLCSLVANAAVSNAMVVSAVRFPSEFARMQQSQLPTQRLTGDSVNVGTMALTGAPQSRTDHSQMIVHHELASRCWLWLPPSVFHLRQQLVVDCWLLQRVAQQAEDLATRFQQEMRHIRSLCLARPRILSFFRTAARADLDAAQRESVAELQSLCDKLTTSLIPTQLRSNVIDEVTMCRRLSSLQLGRSGVARGGGATSNAAEQQQTSSVNNAISARRKALAERTSSREARRDPTAALSASNQANAELLETHALLRQQIAAAEERLQQVRQKRTDTAATKEETFRLRRSMLEQLEGAKSAMHNECAAEKQRLEGKLKDLASSLDKRIESRKEFAHVRNAALQEEILKLKDGTIEAEVEADLYRRRVTLQEEFLMLRDLQQRVESELELHSKSLVGRWGAAPRRALSTSTVTPLAILSVTRLRAVDDDESVDSVRMELDTTENAIDRWLLPKDVFDKHANNNNDTVATRLNMTQEERHLVWENVIPPALSSTLTLLRSSVPTAVPPPPTIELTTRRQARWMSDQGKFAEVPTIPSVALRAELKRSS